MRVDRFVYVAIVAALLPAAALADDPHDPAMRDAQARARDHAMIQQLNRSELAMVRERDAGYAEGWRAVREHRGSPADEAEYTARSQAYDRANADYARANASYARQRAQYEHAMDRWRGAVAACRAGDYYACDN